jgi:hypothetical protein
MVKISELPAASTVSTADVLPIVQDNITKKISITTLTSASFLVGPVGPQGPTGATGATGATGPAGADGDAGDSASEFISISTPFSTVWNSSDADTGLEVRFDGLNVKRSSTTGESGIRASQAQSGGKYYFEVYVQSCVRQFGVTIGVANSTHPVTNAGFNTTNAYVLTNSNGDGGYVYYNGTNPISSATADGLDFVFADGDVVQVAVDITNRLIWFSCDSGASWNGDAGDSPATGVGGLDISGVTGNLYPFLGTSASIDGRLGANVYGRFTQSSFSNSIPTGFSAWDNSAGGAITFPAVINAMDPVFGATGDGVTNDRAALQAAIDTAFVVCYGNASNVPARVGAQRPLYIPAGTYIITSSLQLRGMFGGVMYGAGKFATQIKNTSDTNAKETDSVFLAKGISHSVVSKMYLWPSGGTSTQNIGFDCNWDGTNYVTTQSNTFRDIHFNAGSHGLAISWDAANNCSENQIHNCYFQGCGIGVLVNGFNAVSNNIYGGNFQNCGTAIHVNRGSITVISGVGFQLSTTVDILISNSAHDTMHLDHCRTESSNFLSVQNTQQVHMHGCYQVEAGSAGYFVNTQGIPITIERCYSGLGKVQLRDSATATIRDCYFRNSTGGTADSTWLQSNSSGVYTTGTDGHVELTNVRIGMTAQGVGVGPLVIRRQRNLADGIHQYVTKNHKLVTTTRASTAVATADTAIDFSVAASRNYEFKYVIHYDTPTAADFRYTVTGPSSVTAVQMTHRYIAPGATVATVAISTVFSFTDVVIPEVSGTAGYVEVDGIVHCSTTAGTVAFCWGQGTTDAGNTSVYKGSYVQYSRLNDYGGS